MSNDESVKAEQTKANGKTTPPTDQVSDVNTQDDSPDTPTDSTTDTTAESPSIEDLTRQLAEATEKADNHWESLLRKQAEYDNLQKRMARDLEKARKYALEKFATDLLAVKDSMELGIEAAAQSETKLEVVREGMELTLKMLTDTLSKFDIVEINPLNEKFDPQWHEAMAMQPSPDAEEGTILHLHQKGYQLNDRLLRPARVVVAQAVKAEEQIENQA